MYQWRKMTREEREQTLRFRQERCFPWHSPPHIAADSGIYHVSATCYEHKCHVGYAIKRMIEFSTDLTSLTNEIGNLYAWCVLPNHYHLLIETQNLAKLTKELGKLHGRSSFYWNGEEKTRGRKVWFSSQDRIIRGEGHFWATVNYIHHNPVHHKLVTRWKEWPYSSAAQYLARVGEKRAAEIWKEYPILDYGKGWDEDDFGRI
jgi:putative transposase